MLKVNGLDDSIILFFFCILDYIFYGGNLIVDQVLGPLDEEDPRMKDYRGSLPNPWFPSDHICLVAHFRYGEGEQKERGEEGKEEEPTAKEGEKEEKGEKEGK